MHSDHNVFVQGIEQKRKIKFTLYHKINQQHLVRHYAPIYYSKTPVEEDCPEAYYVWDLEDIEGGQFLALPPSQIVKMELTEETFNTEDFNSRGKKQQNQQRIQALRPTPKLR
jgi:hypothetical protein